MAGTLRFVGSGSRPAPQRLRLVVRERAMVRSGPTLVLVMEQVMAKQAVWGLVVYALVMVGVVVGVDLLLFRNLLWPRLAANIGIVLVFGAFYLRFLRR